VVEQEASKVGLCVNSNKCRVMVSSGLEGSADIYACGATIETVEYFCIVGATYQPLGTVTKKSMCESAKHLAFSQN